MKLTGNWQSRSEGTAGCKCQAAGIAVAHIPAVDNPAVGGIPAAAADIPAAAVDSPGAASAGSPDSDRYTPFDLRSSRCRDFFKIDCTGTALGTTLSLRCAVNAEKAKQRRSSLGCAGRWFARGDICAIPCIRRSGLCARAARRCGRRRGHGGTRKCVEWVDEVEGIR